MGHAPSNSYGACKAFSKKDVLYRCNRFQAHKTKARDIAQALIITPRERGSVREESREARWILGYLHYSPSLTRVNKCLIALHRSVS